MKKMMLSLLMASAMMFAFTSCDKPVDNGGKDDKDDPEKPIGFDASKFECLQGTDYYLIALDETAESAIHSKVVADLRVDDTGTFLYVWDGTYSAGVAVGPNSYGLVEGWTSLVVGSAGWSGCGFCSYKKDVMDLLPAITENPEEYTFHVSMKSQDPAIHEFVMYGMSGEAKIQIGASTTYPYNYERDGEWHEIEIPMTAFANLGLLWNKSQWADADYSDPENLKAGFNVLAILSGASGELNIDACFIYKKAN